MVAHVEEGEPEEAEREPELDQEVLHLGECGARGDDFAARVDVGRHEESRSEIE